MDPDESGSAHGLGPCGEGLRGFESHPPHQIQGFFLESRLPNFSYGFSHDLTEKAEILVQSLIEMQSALLAAAEAQPPKNISMTDDH